jgi:hypothetical protein
MLHDLQQRLCAQHQDVRLERHEVLPFKAEAHDADAGE